MKHLLTLFALGIAMFVCTSASIGLKSDFPEAPHAIITSDSTCSLTQIDFPAFTSEDGVLNIPTHITKDGRIYTVTAIGRVNSSDDYYTDFDTCAVDSIWMADTPLINVVNIPNTVTTIGDGAFSDCSALTSISIPNGVTTIGDGAFSYCDALTSISIPNGVTTIGDDAFSYCYALTSIDIPSSVTTIGNEAFAGCDALTSIDIPSSVTTIGNEAFGWCSALTSISIPNGVTTIGDGAFSSCHALTSIDIPSSVTTIGNYAFGDCEALTSINVANDNPAYCSVGGVLFSKDKTTLCCCPAGTTGRYAPPQGVTTIGNEAFIGCTALTSISIPTGVTTIGDGAFIRCDALTSISIPTSVTTIGESAFSYCDALTSISIPNSVTTIGNEAFRGCYALTSIKCYAKTPPVYEDEYYYSNFPDGITVHVPKGCAQAYRQADFWKNCTIVDDL